MGGKPKKRMYQASEPWYGDNGGMEKLGLEMRYGDVDDPRFREFVAREHLDGGMPVVELHRNHDLPLSVVRKWIALFTLGGRRNLES